MLKFELATLKIWWRERRDIHTGKESEESDSSKRLRLRDYLGYWFQGCYAVGGSWVKLLLPIKYPRGMRLQ